MNKNQQIVSNEGPEAVKPRYKIRYESDKNRFAFRETRARYSGKFSEGRSNGKELSLSALGAFPQGYDPLKRSKKSLNSGQVARSNDYLSDIKLGDHTMLNTAENKYYGFYQRVKDKLEDFWHLNIHSLEAYLLKKGRVFKNDLFTRLKIVLSERGELINILLISSCGVQEFDQAAIESIKEAAPFQNPPKGLIKDGKILIDWGFLVKI